MCKYCDVGNFGNDGYTGENIDYEVMVDGTKQCYEIFILDDIEIGQKLLNVNGTFSDIQIKINYCPMCGEKLN